MVIGDLNFAARIGQLPTGMKGRIGKPGREGQSSSVVLNSQARALKLGLLVQENMKDK